MMKKWIELFIAVGGFCLVVGAFVSAYNNAQPPQDPTPVPVDRPLYPPDDPRSQPTERQGLKKAALVDAEKQPATKARAAAPTSRVAALDGQEPIARILRMSRLNEFLTVSVVVIDKTCVYVWRDESPASVALAVTPAKCP